MNNCSITYQTVKESKSARVVELGIEPFEMPFEKTRQEQRCTPAYDADISSGYCKSEIGHLRGQCCWPTMVVPRWCGSGRGEMISNVALYPFDPARDEYFAYESSSERKAQGAARHGGSRQVYGADSLEVPWWSVPDALTGLRTSRSKN